MYQSIYNPTMQGIGQAMGTSPSMVTPQPQQPTANANMMQQPQQPQSQSFARGGYAHGGKARKGKMVVAHMSPRELDILDHLQGKMEHCPRSGMRSYSHLEELLKNPHILMGIHHHAHKHKSHRAAQHHAQGGEVVPQHNYGNAHLNAMAQHGQHGDSELALIGPHTNRVFRQLAGGGHANPYDGHPQFFALGDTLSGLWDTIKGGAQRAYGAVEPYLPSGDTMRTIGKAALPIAGAIGTAALASKLGPVAGNLLGGTLTNLAGQGLEATGGGEQQAAPPAVPNLNLQRLGNLAHQAAPYVEGAPGQFTPRTTALRGAAAGALRGAGESMQAGHGALQTAGNIAGGTVSGAGGIGGLRKAAEGLVQRMRGTTLAGTEIPHAESRHPDTIGQLPEFMSQLSTPNISPLSTPTQTPRGTYRAAVQDFGEDIPSAYSRMENM